ncbi:MAG TPA: hypothetical protein VGI66_19165, partial [Streptosporangiaceae bacterium]
GAVLRAEGEKQSAILKAEGQAQAITSVFQSIHENDPDPKLLAYQYLQTLPQLAQGTGNTVWVIPSELGSALKAVSNAFDSDGLAADALVAGSKRLAGRLSPPVPAVTAPAEAGSAETALAEAVRTEAALEAGTGAARLAEAPAPEAATPETQLPDAALPEAQLPDAALPETQLPEAELPEVPLPDADLPAVDLPEPAGLGALTATDTADGGATNGSAGPG